LNTDQIKKIVSLVEEFELTELEVEEKGLKLRVSRQSKEIHTVPSPQIIHNIPASTSADVGGQAPAIAVPSNNKDAAEDASLHVIKSPMVGTFYLSPSPDSDPFIKVVDSVDKDTTVCIIEAMKVMNEIHAEAKGKVVEVLVADGESVEFGQPLFKVKP